MDGKIYITISDTPSGEKGENGENGSKKSSDKKKFDYITHQATHFLLNETKTIIRYQVNHIGVRTGDYVAQHNAQQAFNIANKGLGIAVSGVAGFKVAGTLGAAIGIGVGTLTTVTNFSHQYFDYLRQVRFQNREIELIRQRAGFSSIDNGSRQ